MKKIVIDGGTFLVGKLSDDLIPDKLMFDNIWNLHPSIFNTILMYDKEVSLPRWQQSYGRDYYFSGQKNTSMPIPAELEPYLLWAKKFSNSYNGLLLNWYDSDLKHYIGKHSDSEVGLVEGSHIITISIGSDRVFRIRRKGLNKSFQDIHVGNGSVVIIPWNTNRTHTHEVPYLVRYPGRRISITARAF